MVTVFNRKELILTYSMELQAMVRDILSKHDIDYSISTMGNLWRTTRGFGFNPVTQTEYKIYVRRKDYEKAVFLLNEKE